MKLGEKIRYFRRKKELTQKKLGILLGFSESNADTRISQYEAGIRKPSYFVLQNLSHQLDVAMHTELPDAESYDNWRYRYEK